MFVAEEVTVKRESARLGHGLRTWFGALAGRGVRGGPRRSGHGPAQSAGRTGLVAAKLVRVSFLDPVYHGDVMTVGMRWEATGAAGALFPVLDANITISPAGDHTARLALAGSYRPPLGRLGAGVDRAVLHQVAAATMRSLLRNVAAAVDQPRPSRAPRCGSAPGLAPGPGAGDALRSGGSQAGP